MDMGIDSFSDRERITYDEIEALTSALVGYFYLDESHKAIGNIVEEYLIIILVFISY